MSKGSIGFVGIGMMGFPMSSRLLEAGYDVVAYDIRQEAVDRIAAKGAQAATSPADVASRCETILVSMPMPTSGAPSPKPSSVNVKSEPPEVKRKVRSASSSIRLAR